MASPNIISGKDGKVTYGSSPTTLAVTGWTYKPDGGVLKVPNTTDGMRRIVGLKDGEGTVDLHVDSGGGSEAALAVGTVLDTLALFASSALKYTVTSAIVTGIEYKNDVEGTYDATVSWALAIGTPPAAPA